MRESTPSPMFIVASFVDPGQGCAGQGPADYQRPAGTDIPVHVRLDNTRLVSNP